MIKTLRAALLYTCASLLLPFAQPTLANDDEAAAIAVVERLHAGLLQAMQRGSELGFTGRRALLAPVVNETFDFATISRIVLGNHWSTLAEPRQRAFTERFAALTIATYADNFASFSGEAFSSTGSERQASSLIVRTQMRSDTETVRLDYVLRGPGWRIVNVLAQGVSDIALKRADYGAVLAKEGFDALLGKLDDKIRQLENDE